QRRRHGEIDERGGGLEDRVEDRICVGLLRRAAAGEQRAEEDRGARGSPPPSFAPAPTARPSFRAFSGHHRLELLEIARRIAHGGPVGRNRRTWEGQTAAHPDEPWASRDEGRSSP